MKYLYDNVVIACHFIKIYLLLMTFARLQIMYVLNTKE